MRLRVDTYASPVGEIVLVSDAEERLRALDFADFRARMQRLLELHYGTVALVSGPAPAAVRDALDAYFAGELSALRRVEVRTGGSEFQRAVWSALRGIAAGSTESYGELAARLGRPSAARAVGAANGANPVGIVVPCHRVIGARGALTGYAGGVARKKWLLEHERRHAAGVGALESALAP